MVTYKELRSEIGTGSTNHSRNKDITDQVIIGAGSTIIRDIEEAGTYVGSPVRRIK